jgi:hypothetical protein
VKAISKIQLMSRAAVIIFYLLAILNCRCNNSGDVTIKYTDNDPLYFDYKIWGREDQDYITVMLQYRSGSAYGTTRKLKEPSKTELDGIRLGADSSKMSGFFYEQEKPLDSFAGDHVIMFTDSAGKTYRETFVFNPFTVETDIPAVVSRNGLVLQLAGVKPEDLIRIIALDTAFKSRGINDVDTIINGRVMIGRDRLRNLVNGRIHLELYKEEEWPLKNGSSAGGSLSISYGLKREFVLAD